MPAVIVGVKNGDSLLLTKYRTGFAHNALIAGFTEIGETAEETVAREVMEETGLKVTSARYIFSQPNIYRFSGVDIPTLDMFFICEVEDESKLQAADDAAECMWVKLDDIHTEQFGLRSVRWGLIKFMESLKNNG